MTAKGVCRRRCVHDAWMGIEAYEMIRFNDLDVGGMKGTVIKCRDGGRQSDKEEWASARWWTRLRLVHGHDDHREGSSGFVVSPLDTMELWYLSLELRCKKSFPTLLSFQAPGDSSTDSSLCKCSGQWLEICGINQFMNPLSQGVEVITFLSTPYPIDHGPALIEDRTKVEGFYASSEIP